MSKKLTKTEQAILKQLQIRYGHVGRPTNRKKSLIAQIVAVDALLQLNQIKKESK